MSTWNYIVFFKKVISMSRKIIRIINLKHAPDAACTESAIRRSYKKI